MQPYWKITRSYVGFGIIAFAQLAAAADVNFAGDQSPPPSATVPTINPNNETNETGYGDQNFRDWNERETLRSEADPVRTKQRIVNLEIRNSADNSIRKVEETFTTFAWGERLTKRVVDPDGSALTKEWIYETNPRAPGYGCLIKLTDETGYSEEYSYDSQMRLIKMVRQYPLTADSWPGAPSVADTKWKDDGSNSYWFKADGTLVGGSGNGVGISWSQNGNTVTGEFVGGTDTGTVAAASKRIDWFPYTWKYVSGPSTFPFPASQAKDQPGEVR